MILLRKWTDVTSEGRQRLGQPPAREGQRWLFAMLDLVETIECLMDDLINVAGPPAAEAIAGTRPAG